MGVTDYNNFIALVTFYELLMRNILDEINKTMQLLLPYHEVNVTVAFSTMTNY